MSVTVTVDLPENLQGAVQEAGYTWEELAEELRKYTALILFTRQALSLGQAARLANMSLWDFIPFLGQHGVPVATYDAEEIAAEMEAIEWLASKRGS